MMEAAERSMPDHEKPQPDRTQAQKRAAAGVRAVAVFEGTKGLLVLAAGFGLLSLLHRDVQSLAEEAVRRLHLNPAHHYPEIFIRAAGRLEDSRLVWLASGAFAYAAFRLVEAFGLWHERPWAEWLAIVSAGLYLPVEIFELWKHASILGALLLIGNAALVLGLLHIRLKAIETR